MNIFVDYHHDDLYYSLYLLLEKRLGHNLYRPIGMEWFEQGYWDIGNPYSNPADTAKQYLGIDDRTWDAYKNLNGDYHIENGIYHVFNPPHKFHHKAITLEKLKEMKFDIIIASYPFGHEQTYQRLLNDFQPQAKLIVHEGNIYQQSNAKNVLSSTVPHPTDQNVVFYHQEFDLEIYKYHPPKNTGIIRSFVNGLPRRDLYLMYRNYLPEFTFEAYGSGEDMDGTISSEEEIAKLMSESMFGWHIKSRGDGFGHVIHNWYACGRPVITYRFDYADKLAASLLIDGETCIDLEQGGIEDNLKKIRYWAEPENHKRMCENAYNKFKEIVNFEAEAEQIKKFLENLQ